MNPTLLAGLFGNSSGGAYGSLVGSLLQPTTNASTPFIFGAPSGMNDEIIGQEYTPKTFGRYAKEKRAAYDEMVRKLLGIGGTGMTGSQVGGGGNMMPVQYWK